MEALFELRWNDPFCGYYSHLLCFRANIAKEL